MQKLSFGNDGERLTSLMPDSVALMVFRRDFGDAVRLFNEMLQDSSFQSDRNALHMIGESLIILIDLVRQENTCIDQDLLWGGAIKASFMPAIRERFGFTDLEWNNLEARILDACIRSSVECGNPENSYALLKCASRLLESNRDSNSNIFIDGSQENLYRWKMLTARHAVIAAKHVGNGAEVLSAAKEALGQCACDFRELWKATARLESAINKG